MKAINFVVRTGADNSQTGQISADQSVYAIDAGRGQEISLNIRQSDISGYSRAGGNLELVLADGRVVVLEEYFAADGTAASRLFISADGYINEVTLFDGGDGVVYAQYGPTEQWGKWSPTEDLIFLEGGDLAVASIGDDEVSMLGAPLLAGSGLLGALGAGTAGLGAAAALGGGGDSGGAKRIEPTINEPGPIVVAGDEVDPETEEVTITGTAEPGSTVVVTVGEETVETTPDEDGNWSAGFSGDDFPADGDHTVTAVVTEPDDTVTELTGPEVLIDTTGPEIVITDGTVSVGEVINAAEYEDGITIAGTGEPGASIAVTVETVTHETVVDEEGGWSVVFAPGELSTGELTTGVEVVSVDVNGNSSTLTDAVEIDTIPHDLTIDTETVGGDGVVNLVENSEGFTITGSSAPGAEVTVEVAGGSQTVTVDETGTWVAVYDSDPLAGGEYEATVTASTVDAAGNASSTTGTFRVDTEVRDFTMQSAPGGADGVINSAEHGAGITVTGTTEPGGTVMLDLNGETVTATVAEDGSWSAQFTAEQVATGTYTATMTATTTDAAGNVETLSQEVVVDTDAGALTIAAGEIGGDGTVNAAERDAGVEVTGTADPGATVLVTLDGVEHSTEADANGDWSTTYSASEITPGTHAPVVSASTTDAAGNSTDVSDTVRVDTEVVNFAIGGMSTGADDVLNAAERAEGFTVTGTTEPGATVVLEMNGHSVTATVAEDGSWTARFAEDEVDPGSYTGTLTATTTDPAGNVETLTGSVDVDTDAGTLTLNADIIGGDGTVNAAERDAGVEVTGTADPGATVLVTLDGVEHSTQADGNGDWTTTYSQTEITAGTHVPVVSAVTTDAAGNSIDVSDTVQVDTEVLNLAQDPYDLAVARDGTDVINNAVATRGFDLTGTVEIGSTVMVTLGGVAQEADVDAAGNWTASFPADALASGERDLPVEVDVTDPAGNTASLSDTLRLDTLVNALARDAAPIEGDGIVNAAEAADGVQITGQVEPGSLVTLDVFGGSYTATVSAGGAWTVDIPAADLPRQEVTADMVISATDNAGNTASITEQLTLDLVAPDQPEIVGTFRETGGGYRNIATQTSDDAVSVHKVAPDGAVSEIALHDVENTLLGETDHFFLDANGQSTTISDGSELVVTSTDAAGNSSSTYVVLDETSTVSVDLGTLEVEGFNIDEIDLGLGDKRELTITEEHLRGLSENGDQLVVRGGADDTVTISGANAAGTMQIGDDSFSIYTLGTDGATIIVDDEVNVVT